MAGGVPPRAVSPLVVFPPAVFGGCCPSGSFVARSCYFPWIYLTLCLLAAVHQTTLSCRVAARAARRATAPGQTLPVESSGSRADWPSARCSRRSCRRRSARRAARRGRSQSSGRRARCGQHAARRQQRRCNGEEHHESERRSTRRNTPNKAGTRNSTGANGGQGGARAPHDV